MGNGEPFKDLKGRNVVRLLYFKKLLWSQYNELQGAKLEAVKPSEKCWYHGLRY